MAQRFTPQSRLQPDQRASPQEPQSADRRLTPLEKDKPLSGNWEDWAKNKGRLSPTIKRPRGWQAVAGLGPPDTVPVPAPAVDVVEPDENTEIAKPIKQATQAQTPENPGIRHQAVSTYGVSIPVSIGRRVITGNIIDASPIAPVLIGGGGGSGGGGVTTETGRIPVYDGDIS